MVGANKYSIHESHEPVILDPRHLNVIAAGSTAVTVLALLVVYVFRWGPDSLDDVFGDLAAALVVAAVYVVGLALHECLHLLGYVVFGGVSLENVSLSFHGVMARAHCETPIPTRAYRVAVALPGVVLGLAPLFIGLGAGLPWVVFFGALMSAVALGDIRVLAAVRDLRVDRPVILR